jgi:hypothetical protein
MLTLGYLFLGTFLGFSFRVPSRATNKPNPMNRVAILFLFVFAFACSTKQSPIDLSPGIQDVVLGADISQFKDRIRRQDSLVTTPDGMQYDIDLNTQIGEDCKGGWDKAVRVYTFKGRIMLVTIPTIGCRRLSDIFINKFGQPTTTIGDTYSWVGTNCELTLKDTGDHYRGDLPAYEITFVEKNIYADYQKSAKGNI